MTDGEREWREWGLREAVLAGDERAWRTWYDESYSALEAFVVWRCGGLRGWAEDVLQETWLTAVRRVRDFDPRRSSFLTWLRGIAVNVVRNTLRRERFRTHESLGTPLSPATDVAWRVAEALAELPEHYEHVLRSKYLDGHSVEEIARLRGESFKTVESLLTRARTAFRTVFGDDQPAPAETPGTPP
jgi:RNA polymerase sigma-70 factor (ECF subfamily)